LWRYYYIEYDDHGRVALTQDGRQAAAGQWTFTKYDNLDRPVLTGILTGGTYEAHRSALQMQTAFGETRGSTLHGYTNLTYPQTTVAENVLTV
jgi:hypothetical protein